MSYATPALIALGRVLMSIMFIVEGFEKIPGYAGTQGYMEAHNVPGLLLPLVIAIELGGGLCVLLGLFTRWAAILLAALLFHADFAERMQMIHFMKDITIAGGFLLLAGAGPGALALDNLRKS
ncbi:MAG: DoxX family protein [Hyphomicrobiales bacterium]|nr:MAG: DoxX family protein [Hyphomicrobiales bacterium]